jgi:hypothetical protein
MGFNTLKAALLVMMAGCSASAIGTQPSGLVVSFDAPSTVQSGDSALLRLTLRNHTKADITLRLYGEGNLAFDPYVRRLEGPVVWQWSSNLTIMSGALERNIHPGDSATFQAVWPLVDDAGAPVPAEEYLITPLLKDTSGNPILGESYTRHVRVLNR